MPLKLGANLTVPDDATTQTWGFIGHKGSGKSYSAMKLAEELLGAGRQVVALDPVGVWYGLRLSSSGKSPSGLKLPILGGLRGDVPLEEKAGKTVADFLVDTGSSAILDVSLFRKGQRKLFVADFAEQLFHRQKAVRRPLMLFIEEAQVFAPQMAKGEERMLGAIEDIVRIGRNFGLGAAMITQRPQSVNKEVLNQVEPLCVFRLIAKHERDAVKGWLQHVGADAETMLEGLHALKQGDCWFWSPSWLDRFEKTRFGKRSTFDASSTPTGKDSLAPATLKPVDLGKLTTAIAESIKTAEANDPKKLKARVAELERQLAAKPAAAAAAKPAIDQASIDNAVARRDERWKRIAQNRLDRLRRLHGELATIADKVVHEVVVCGQEVNELLRESPATHTPRATPQPVAAPRPAAAVAKTGGNYAAKYPAAGATGSLSGRQQTFLDAAAALATLGAEVTRETVSAWVGVHPRGGSVGEVLKALVDAELITNERGRIEVTPEGMAAAGHVDPGQAIERAKAGLTARQAKFFETIVDWHPNGVTREQIAEAFSIHPRGGSLGEDLGRLVGRGLVERERGSYRARDFLFAGR